MGRRKSNEGETTANSPKTRRKRLPKNPDARDEYLFGLAIDCVEERLRNGTASASEVVHILKLGSEREKLEIQRLHEEVELAKAKTENLKAERANLDMYERALKAMQRYSGEVFDGDDE